MHSHEKHTQAQHVEPYLFFAFPQNSLQHVLVRDTTQIIYTVYVRVLYILSVVNKFIKNNCIFKVDVRPQ